MGNLQAHRRELRRHRQIRSEAIKALKVNVKKKEHYEYFQEKVQHASSDGDQNDSASVNNVNKASSLRSGGACSVTILTAITGITSYMGLWIVLPIFGLFDLAYTLYFGPGEITFDILVVDVLIMVDMSFTLVYWAFHYTYVVFLLSLKLTATLYSYRSS